MPSRTSSSRITPGAVIVLLLYFFLSAAVMLFGAEVNAAIARYRGEAPEKSEG